MKHPSIAYCPTKAVLPIIFVPGIMGSRLRISGTTDDKAIVWDPPRSGNLPRDATRAADPVIPESEWQRRRHPRTGRPQAPNEAYTRNEFASDANEEVQDRYSGAWEWGWMDGSERRERLIGPRGTSFNETYLEVDRGQKEKFANRLGPDIVDMALERGWGGCVWEFYGGFLRWLHYHGGAAISPGGDVRLEVWAHPYNWTDDNTNAARDLAQTVDKAYADAQKKYAGKPDYPVCKPVVITHSMGGLVGRAYAKHFGGESTCQAMIHGAMPTHGAPAAYKRMRAGFEGLSSIVLGRNGEQVTAVLANSPGGLELLPNQFHKTADGGQQWLFIEGPPDQPRNSVTLPKSDPYGEIYLNTDKWWRLVNPEWVNPSKDDGFELFTDQLEKAKIFHDSLGEYFHPNTMLFWSDDHLAWDRVEITALNTSLAPEAVATEYEFAYISPPAASGDGTVHSGSGKYVPDPVESIHTHTEDGTGLEFTHEAAFSGQNIRSQIAFWLNEMVEEHSG
ncbi:hypothetical protein TH44_11310 [Thalassospira xiamenensis]|jgi:pimeloyl-ACP methyl ester carboxylesterase|uniref:Uncharacterized protein n=1 Tax=Thalassospira xiamenensis TaxID=220697 RepID=A0A367XA80_9PROT|nr:hypothetical protein TH44_11310 [Thalassospira xiamenensis]